MDTGIVWFRRDLRLQDNPALDAAIRAHDRVLCVYIYSPDEEKPWQPGAASRWWLHHSLIALDADLRKRGAELHVVSGKSLAALKKLVRLTKARAVYFNRLYEPACIERDEHAERELEKIGVNVNISNAALLAEPWTTKTQQGEPYKVFTPFWRKLRRTTRADTTPSRAGAHRKLAHGGQSQRRRSETASPHSVGQRIPHALEAGRAWSTVARVAVYFVARSASIRKGAIFHRKTGHRRFLHIYILGKSVRVS